MEVRRLGPNSGASQKHLGGLEYLQMGHKIPPVYDDPHL